MDVTLTVFFDGQFWVGMFERVDEGKLTAARVVFGAEPREQEVLEWVLTGYAALRFSPAVDGAKAFRPAANPKRRQRQAAQAVSAGVGTKSQQAMQLAREENKQARKEQSKEAREALAAYKTQLRIEKKKARHRGH